MAIVHKITQGIKLEKPVQDDQLHWIVAHGSLTNLYSLIEHPYSDVPQLIAHKDNEGRNALFPACYMDLSSIAYYFLSHNMQLFEKDKEEKTIWHIL